MTKTVQFHSALIILICIVMSFTQSAHAIKFPDSSDHINYTTHEQKSLDDFIVEYVEDDLGISVMNFTGNYDRNINNDINIQARQAVLRSLYHHHQDIYDFVYIFTTFEFDTGLANAFAVSLKNTTQGIGIDAFDNSQHFFSQRLKNIIDMAALSRRDFNPNGNGYDPLLDTMVHETMHHWGISVNYLDANGQVSDRLLGRSNSHWNYFLNSQASVMYGSFWEETSPGAFDTTDIRHGLSPLDLYLAGFLGKESVPDFFIINNADSGESTDLPPPIGTSVNGEKETISINDIIAHEGPRVPNHLNAQNEFNVKFVLLKSADEQLDESQLASLYLLQDAFQKRFYAETRGVGHVIFPQNNNDQQISDPATLNFNAQLNDAFDLNGAVNFLNNALNDDHWQDSKATKVRDTVNVIQALALIVEDFPQMQSALNAAILWINNHQAANNDELAWMLISGVLNTDKRQSVIEQLLNAVNADGGWGFSVYDQSSSYDTTLVLNGLMTAQGINPLISSKNKQYIIDQINTDHGLSYTENGTSSISASSLLLPIVAEISNDPQDLADLKQYVINTKLPDNGFGSEAISSPHETALVIKALESIQSIDDESNQNTINLARSALNTMQSTDGSMRGSVYSTALAISVFNNNDKANLSFASVELNNTFVVSGEHITLNYQINNTGNTDATNVEVSVYSNDISTDNILLETQLALVAANDAVSGAFTIDTSTLSGDNRLIVVLDQANTVSESNEADNTFTTVINVTPVSDTPELVFNYNHINIAPDQFNQLPVLVTVNAEVMNLSLIDVDDVLVTLNVINTDGSMTELTSQTLSLGAQSSSDYQLSAQINQANNDLNFKIIIDPLNAITEVNDNNNQHDLRSVKVSAVDVTLNSEDINIPSALIAGNNYDVDYAVKNIGTDLASAFDVKVYAEKDGNSQLIHQSQISELVAGSALSRTFNWQPSAAGNHQLTFIVDELAVLPETNENNNQVIIPVQVLANTQTNVRINADDVIVMPDPGLQGQDLQLSVNIHNDSSINADGFAVSLYRSHENGQPNTLLATLINDGMAANASEMMNFMLEGTPLSGHIEFIITIDSDNDLLESDENDNTVFKTINILSQADVYVSRAGVQLTPSIPVLGVPLDVVINVSNLGEQDANNVNVHLYHDISSQSNPVFIDNQVIDLLLAGQSQTVNFSFNFPDNADIDSLTVRVDENNLIEETNENNNTATLQFSNQDQSLYVSHRYFSPNGDGNQDNTVIAFNVDEASNHQITVLDENYQTIKTLSPPTFLNSQFGEVLWDGRNNDNVVARDGQYVIQLVNSQQSVIAQSLVTLDNNQSSLIAALAENNGYFSDLNCLGRSFSQFVFAKDGKSAFVKGFIDNNGVFRRGIYQVKNDASNLSTVISDSFLDGRELIIYYVLDNGDLLFLLKRNSSDYQFFIKKQSDGVINQLNYPSGISFSVPSVMAITQEFAIIQQGSDGVLRKLPFDNTIGLETMQLSQSMTFETELNTGLLMSVSGSDFPLRDLYFIDYAFNNEQLIVEDIHPDDIPQLNLTLSSDQKNFVLNHQNQIKVYSLQDNVVINLFNQSANNINDVGINTHNELLFFNSDTSITLKNLNDSTLLQTDTTFVMEDFGTLFDHVFSVAVILPSDNEIFFDRTAAIDAFPVQNLVDFTVSSDKKEMLLLVENNLIEVFNSPPCDFFFDCNQWPDTVQGKVGAVLTAIKLNYQDPQNIVVESSVIDVYSTFEQESNLLSLHPIQEGRSHYVRINDRAGSKQKILNRQLLDGVLITENNDQDITIVNSFPHFYSSDINNSHTLIPSRNTIDIFNQFYVNTFNQLGACEANGNYHYIYRSKNNLYADVHLTRNQQAIEIETTAFDENFDHYDIHWASSENPNVWQLLYSSVNSTDQEVVLNWIPDDNGFYQVRIQAYDRAGNKAQDIENISINNSNSDITDITVSPNYFSPDGDGNNDNVTIAYQVLTATEVLVNITDKNGQLVRTINNQYLTVPAIDELSWDGKDSNGAQLPDGEYRVEVQGFVYTVFLDTTPIVTNNLAMSLNRPSVSSEGYAYVSQLSFPINLVDIVKSQHDDYASHDYQIFDLDTGQWQSMEPLSIILNNENIEQVMMSQLRLEITDKAGNRGFSMIDIPATHYKKVELLKFTENNEIGSFELFEFSNEFPNPSSAPEVVDWSNGETLAYAIQAFDYQAIESITFRTSHINDQQNIIVNEKLVNALPVSSAMRYKPSVFVGNNANVNALFDITIDNTALPILIVELHENDFPQTENPIDVGIELKQIGQETPILLTSQIQFINNQNNDGELAVNLSEIDFSTDFDASSLGLNAQQAYLDIINTVPYNESFQYIWAYQNGAVDTTNETLIATDTKLGSVLNIQAYSPDFVDVTENYVSRLYILNPNACKVNRELVWNGTLSNNESLGSNVLEINNDFCLTPELSSKFYVGEFCNNTDHNNTAIRFDLQANNIDALSNRPFLVELYQTHETNQQDLIFADTNPQLQSDGQGGFSYRRSFDFDRPSIGQGTFRFNMVIYDDVGNILGEGIELTIDDSAAVNMINQPQENVLICAEQASNNRKIMLGSRVAVDSASAYFLDAQLVVNGANSNNNDVVYQGYNDFSILKDNANEVELMTTLENVNQGNFQATLLVETFNASGISSCSTVNFNVDAMVDYDLIDAAPTIEQDGRLFNLFSPNNDGIKDQFSLVTIQANENLHIEVQLYESPANTLLGTIISRSLFNTTTDQLNWDGFLDGELVNDGNYQMVMTISDDCGLFEEVSFPITIDTTAPSATFISPTDASALSSINRVIIDIQEANLLNNRAEIESQIAERIHVEFFYNNVWNALSLQELIINPQTSVYQAQLDWNLTALPAAIYPLRINIEDRAGNRSSTQINPELISTQNIFWSFSATPLYISPNADNRQDALNIAFGLSVEAVISVSVVDINDNIITTVISDQTFNTGVQQLSFNGMHNTQILNDGVYQVRIEATDVLNVNNTSTLTLPFTIDNTAAELQWLYPNQAVVKGTVNAQVSISESNIQSVLVNHQQRQPLSPLNGIFNGQQTGIIDVMDLSELNETTHQFTAEVTDLAGNMTSSTLDFVIDNTSPQLDVVTPEQGFVISASQSIVSINGSILDEHFERYEISIAESADVPMWQSLFTGNELTNGTDFEYLWQTNHTDGDYLLRIRAIDQANWMTDQIITVTIDKTAPQSEITTPQNTAIIGKSQTISGTAQDQNFDFYTLSYRLNTSDQWQLFHTSQSSVENGLLGQLPESLVDGEYDLRLTVYDKAGQFTQTNIRVTLDALAPQAPNALTIETINNRDVSLQWQSSNSNDIAGYQVYRNGELQTAQTITNNTYTDVALIDGDYHYWVVAIDVVGNVSDASNTVAVTIDTTPPMVNIITPANGQRVNNTVEVFGDAYSQLDFESYQVYLRAEGDTAPGTLINASPIAVNSGLLAQFDTTALIQDHHYIIRLQALDNNNNIATWEQQIYVDNTAPSMPLNLTGQLQGNNAVSLQWDANNDGDLAGYLVLFNGVVISGAGDGNATIANAIDATSFTASILPDGNHVFNIIAIDLTGNLSAISNDYSVNIDARVPDTSIITPFEGQKIESPIIFEAISVDTDLANITFEYSTDGFNWLPMAIDQEPPYQTSLNPQTLNLTFGEVFLRAFATDTSAQIDASPAQLAVEYADLTAPAAVAELTAIINGADITLNWQHNTESDLQGYVVKRTINDQTSTLTTQPTVNNQYVDSNLADGQYRYEVFAIDHTDNHSQGESTALLQVFSITVKQPFSPILEPAQTYLQGQSPRQDGVIKVMVNNANGSQTLTDLDLSLDQKFISPMIELANGINDLAVVQHINAGHTSRTNTVQVERSPTPQVPMNFQANAIGLDVQLNWQVPDGNTLGYIPYRNGHAITPTTLLFTGLDFEASSNEFSVFNVLDGSLQTGWNPSFSDLTNETPAYFQINFDQARLLSAFEIHWGTDGSTITTPSRYHVQYQSSVGWVTVAEFNRDTQTVTEAITNISTDVPYLTDSIRVVMATSPGVFELISIAELRIIHQPLTNDTSLTISENDGQYTYQVASVNNQGFISDKTSAITLDIGDVIAPDAVVLSGEVSGVNNTNISWSASASADVSQYWVFRNANLVHVTTDASVLNYTDTALANGSYDYTVKAVDAAGNVSADSNTITLTIEQQLLDAPENLTIQVELTGGALTLNWQAISSVQLQNYRIYRSVVSGSDYMVIADTTDNVYTDTGLTNGTRYYYVVVAVDTFGNESQYSNQVSAIAADGLAASMPVITSPTVHGAAISVSDSFIDIAGSADPGVLVDLYINGNYTSTIQSETDFSINQQNQFDDIDTIRLSQSGQWAAYTDHGDSLIVKNIVTNERTSRFFDFPEFTWNNTGDKLYIIGFDDQFGGYKVSTYDTRLTEISILLRADDIISAVPSPDESQLIYQGDYFNPQTAQNESGLWLFNINSDQTVNVPLNGSISTTNDSIKWSDDGQYISLINTNDNSIHLYHVPSQNLTQIDTEVNGNIGNSSHDWSPDNRSFIYDKVDGQQQLYQYDVENAQITAISLPESSFASALYSTDAEQIIYRQGCCNLQLFDVNNQTSTTIFQGQSSIRSFIWSSKHGILIVTNLKLTQLSSPGGFVFNNVMLNSGSNDIHVLARDGSGLASDPSLPITIELQASGMADLSVDRGDLVINPLNALPDQAIVASVLIQNTGDTPAIDVPIQVLMTLNDGTVIDVTPSENRISLGAGQSESLFIDVGQVSVIGDHVVQVMLDHTNELTESNESNNNVFKSFSVVADLEPNLQLFVAPQQLAPEQSAEISITVNNPGVLFNGQVQLNITDQSGFSVENNRQYPIQNLQNNDSLSINDQWLTQGLFSGDYQLSATLLADNGTEIEQLIRSVSIQAVAEFQVMLDVTSSTIEQGNNLLFATEISYLNGNVAQNAQLNWQVINADNQQILWDNQQQLSAMLPGFNTVINGQWASADLSSSGDYMLRLHFTADNDQQTLNIPFSVVSAQQVIDLMGQIEDNPSQIILGRDFVASYQLDNIGDQDLANIDVNLALLDAETFTQISSQTSTVSLTTSENIALDAQFSTQLLDDQNYLLVLKADLSSVGLSDQQLLDSRTMTSIDAQGPEITLINPQNNALTTANPDIRFTVRDQFTQISAIQLSSPDVNQGQPIDININGFNQQYHYPLFNLADGPYQFSITAIDANSNSSQQQFSFLVDGTAPIIEISGVADGELYNSTVTSQVQISDENLQSSQIILDGQIINATQQISQEGSHLLIVNAIDAVGNRSTQSVGFRIDLTAPQVDITFPENNAQLSNDTTMVAGNTEPFSQVTVVIGNYTATVQSDNNGDFSFVNVPLQSGNNTIQVQAQDLATNTSQAAIITVTVAAAIDVQASMDLMPTAPIEQDLVINYQLTNLTNNVLTDLPVRIQLFDGNNNTLIDTQTNNANLSAAQAIEQSMQFSTAGLIPEKYVVLLSVFIDNQWQFKDGGQLVLKDTTAPQITINVPVADQFYPNQLDSSVVVTDQYSAVQHVNYQIDNTGNWIPMVNSGDSHFIAELSALSHGEHQIKYQMSDINDNLNETNNRRFVVDNNAPQITIINPVDGTLTNQNVQINYQVSDDSVVNVQSLLNDISVQNGTIISDEGHYELSVSATDQVSNSAQKSVQFIIDKTAPNITINDLVDGQQLDINLININGSTEPRARVTLNNEGAQYQIVADENGQFTFTDIALKDGDNPLRFAATDQANNASAETLITVTFTNSGQCQIFGFKGATPYNVMVFDDYQAQSSSVGGRIAAAGNININDYTAGEQLTLDGANDVLVSGADINFATGQVFFGNILAAGQANIGQDVIDNMHPNAQIISQAILPIDFASTFDDVSLFSSGLAQLPVNSSHVLNNGVLELQGACQMDDQQVYQITAQELSQTRSISNCRFDAIDDAPYIIINVSGSLVRFNQFDGTSLIDISQKVIFNFTQATAVHINNSQIFANVLAVNATIGQPVAVDLIFSNGFESADTAGSTITGQIIARSWHSNGMMNHKPLQCTGSIPINSAPLLKDIQVNTSTDQAIQINVDAIDENRDGLIYHIIDLPQSGSIEGNPPLFLYKPNTGFNGDDAFSYQVTDELGQTSSASVTITVGNAVTDDLNSTHFLTQLLGVIVTYGEEQ